MERQITAAGGDEQAAEHKRVEPRDSMFLMGMMRRPNGPEVPIKVRNLSSGGMMVESPMGFSKGEPIEADLRGIGPITGKIAWAAGGRVGVAFDRVVDPALARRPVAGGPQPQLVKTARSMWRPGLSLK